MQFFRTQFRHVWDWNAVRAGRIHCGRFATHWGNFCSALLRALATWLLLNRARLRPLAIVGIFCGLLGIFLVHYYPGNYQLGPFRITLHAMRNPIRILIISFIARLFSTNEILTSIIRTAFALVQDWRKASRLGRVLIFVAAVQLIALANTWTEYPGIVISQLTQCEDDDNQSGKTWVRYKHSDVNLFAKACREALPEDARILYHGHIEGMLFSYEVYPRRVFMLPEDYFDISLSWQKQPWLKGMPDDPLEEVWHKFMVPLPSDREAFLKQHGITHEVWFSEDEPLACQWRKIR